MIRCSWIERKESCDKLIKGFRHETKGLLISHYSTSFFALEVLNKNKAWRDKRDTYQKEIMRHHEVIPGIVCVYSRKKGK